MEKRDRLRSTRDFQNVYRGGKSLYNREFTIYMKKNSCENSRFGFSISKKIGKAYERNLLKRRLREIIRLNRHVFKEGFDYVIIPKAKAKNMDFGHLKSSLFHCYNKARKNRK